MVGLPCTAAFDRVSEWSQPTQPRQRKMWPCRAMECYGYKHIFTYFFQALPTNIQLALPTNIQGLTFGWLWRLHGTADFMHRIWVFLCILYGQTMAKKIARQWAYQEAHQNALYWRQFPYHNRFCYHFGSEPTNMCLSVVLPKSHKLWDSFRAVNWVQRNDGYHGSPVCTCCAWSKVTMTWMASSLAGACSQHSLRPGHELQVIPEMAVGQNP